MSKRRQLTQEQKERKTAYDLQYSAAHITKRVIDFNRGSESDMKILDHLDAQPNKSRYVKDLISDDMSKAGG